MKALWQRWVARLAHKEPATALALFRVLVGLVVVRVGAVLLLHNVIPELLVDKAHGGYRNLGALPWLVELLGGATPEVLTGMTWALILGGLLLTLGLGGRLTALVVLQLCIALFRVNPETGGGHDTMTTNALWLLVLAPSTATLSLDCRLRRGRWRSDRLVAAWPRYLVIYQLVLIYGTTGAQKISPEWHPWGDWSALYYAVQLPYWARMDNSWVASVYPLSQLATLSTWLWEAGAPLLLLAFWYRATRDRPGLLRALFNRLDVRSLYALAGVGMHLGIWALMDVGPFSWISLAMYPCLWHHDEWVSGLNRLRARLGSPRPAPSEVMAS